MSAKGKFEIGSAKERATQGIDGLQARQLEKFESLMRFHRELKNLEGLSEVIEKGLDFLSQLGDCDQIFLYSLSQEKSKKFLERELISGRSLLEVRLPWDESSFAGSAALNKKAQWVASVDQDIRYRRNLEELSRFGVATLVSVPLIINRKVIGVIQALWAKDHHPKGEECYFFESACELFSSSYYSADLLRKGQEQFLQIAQAFADTIGKKDSYTGGHTRRVALYSKMISDEMPDLNEKERRELHVASVLHDLGKIGVEDAILKKKAPLDAAEFELMKLHPDLGYDILKCIEGLDNILDAVRFHHERPDGKGYPHGLKGDEIPPIARIVAVADTFDAMTSNRPYRNGLAPMVAYEEIVMHSGTQFDPKVVDAFVRGFKKTAMYRKEDDPFLQEVLPKAG